MMRQSLFAALFIFLFFHFGIESSRAQPSTHIVKGWYPPTGGEMVEADFTVNQVFIPYSDSGQWVPCEIDITNNLDTPDTINVGLVAGLYKQPYNFNWGPYDSVIGGWRFPTDTGLNAFRREGIIIPGHTHTPDVRINVLFCWPRPDTFYAAGGVSVPIYDEKGQYKGFSEANFHLVGVGNCAPFDGILNRDTLINRFGGQAGDTLVSTLDTGANLVHGQSGFGFWSPSESLLSASFKVVGEFADSFRVSYVNPITPDTNHLFSISFSGSPQHIVHDTIVGTYSNCQFSFTERKPIVGSTVYVTTHTLSFSPDTTIIPFLGQTPQFITIHNTTALRMEAYNFSEKHDWPYEFLPLWPPSNVLSIPPFDSASIEILARDNPGNDRGGFRWHDDLVRFNLRLPDQPGMITDTTGEMDLRSYVNVYCPEYFSYVPELKHGIHPAGIVFGNYDSPFKTVYGNDDNENYTFFQPYFDDSRFQISIDPTNGALPRIVTPAIGDWMYATTTFTGDDKHDNQTQLHWPRQRVRDGMLDTVTIDVVEIGLNAPPYQPTYAVREQTQEHLIIWPNPATTFISIIDPNSERLEGTITDILGRNIKTFAIEGEKTEIDIRDIPPGMYLLRIPSMGMMSQVSIVR